MKLITRDTSGGVTLRILGFVINLFRDRPGKIIGAGELRIIPANASVITTTTGHGVTSGTTSGGSGCVTLTIHPAIEQLQTLRREIKDTKTVVIGGGISELAKPTLKTEIPPGAPIVTFGHVHEPTLTFGGKAARNPKKAPAKNVQKRTKVSAKPKKTTSPKPKKTTKKYE